MVYNYELNQMNADNAQCFYEMLSYVSPHIEKVECKEGAVSIYFEKEYEKDILENISILDNMITSGGLNNKKISIKTLSDHTDVKVTNNEPIFNDLKANGDIKEICQGVFAYSGLYLKIYNYFSRKVEEFGQKNFPDITQYEFPVLYPIDDFEKGGYFESFPHYIMFQTVMKNDIKILDRFAKSGTQDKEIFNEMRTPQNVLRSAACVPVYQFLKDRELEDEGKTYMVSGKCFRNEGENVSELSRLIEFYMKEYVFIGTPDQCVNGVEKAKQLWDFWTHTFNLNCKVDTANDSFFASNYKKLKMFQVLGDSKQEFKWYQPGDQSYVACSSVNYHRTHFSKPYNIKNTKNSLCYTACFAFGIDRLAYVFLAQKGLNPKLWDHETYQEIIKYTGEI